MTEEETFKKILSRLKRLEKTVFGKTVNTSNVVKIDKIQKKNSLTTLILQLRGQGFFEQSKTVAEAYVKLQSVYPCDTNRVAVALVRLRKAGELRKTSKLVHDKQLIAYAW